MTRVRKRRGSERKRKPARKEKSGSGDKERPDSRGSSADDESHLQKLPSIDGKSTPEPGLSPKPETSRSEASMVPQPPSKPDESTSQSRPSSSSASFRRLKGTDDLDDAGFSGGPDLALGDLQQELQRKMEERKKVAALENNLEIRAKQAKEQRRQVELKRKERQAKQDAELRKLRSEIQILSDQNQALMSDLEMIDSRHKTQNDASQLRSEKKMDTIKTDLMAEMNKIRSHMEAQLTKERADFASTLHMHQDKNQSLSEELTGLTTLRSEEKKTAEKIRKERGDFSKQLLDQRLLQTELRKELVSRGQEKDALHKEREHLRRQAHIMQNQLLEYEEMRQKHEKMQNELQDKFLQEQAAKKKKEEEALVLEQKRKKLDRGLANTQEVLKKEQDAKRQLARRASDLRRQNEHSKKTAEDLKWQMARKEEQARHEADSLRTAIHSRDEILQKQEMESDNQRHQLQAEKADLEEETELLRSELDSRGDMIEANKRQKSLLARRASNLRREGENYRDHIAGLQAEITTSGDTHAERDEEVARLHREMVEMKTPVEVQQVMAKQDIEEQQRKASAVEEQQQRKASAQAPAENSGGGDAAPAPTNADGVSSGGPLKMIIQLRRLPPLPQLLLLLRKLLLQLL